MAGKPKTGPSALVGSQGAKLKVAVVLEALAGIVSTTEAAERMGVSLARYYQLELRALQGMMTALEPRERGPGKSPEKALAALSAEKKQVERELRRYQALLRAATRSVGLKSLPKRKGAKQKVRRKRGASRGKRVLATLRRETSAAERGKEGADESAQSTGAADRAPGGE